MTELWQLYDNQGRAIPEEGATKDEVFTKALLHAASHVWIWRRTDGGVELLLQKRAVNKRTFPGLYDISAAGHIDLGEDPLDAAIRETQEEIGYTVRPDDLCSIGVVRTVMEAADKSWTENEFSWLYLLEMQVDAQFVLADAEVDLLEWRPLAEVMQEVSLSDPGNKYVPHGSVYYQIVFEGLRANV